MIINDLPADIKSKIFFDYYQNKNKKSILYNLRLEKSNLNICQLINTDMNQNDDLIKKLSLKSIKLNHIKHLNKILGLKTSCENNKIIKKNNVKILRYLNFNIDSINTAYLTNYKFQKGNAMHNNLTCFNMIEKIYSNWSGLHFKSHEKDKGGTKLYITKSNDIIMYLNDITQDNITKSYEIMLLEEHINNIHIKRQINNTASSVNRASVNRDRLLQKKREAASINRARLLCYSQYINEFKQPCLYCNCSIFKNEFKEHCLSVEHLKQIQNVNNIVNQGNEYIKQFQQQNNIIK